MRRRHTAEERERLIAEVKAGEMPRVVAERLGVCASSAYRWVKDAASGATVDAPMFARVVPSGAAPRTGVVVQLGRASIRVESGFDAELLRAVVSALGELT